MISYLVMSTMKRSASEDDQEITGLRLNGPAKKRSKVTASAAKACTSDEERADGTISDESREDNNDEDEALAGKKAASKTKMPSGMILKGGRVRLPDKLMEYLNKEVVPGVLYWQKGGESFSFDTKRAQKELLDKYFSGTKLSSFTRSLNRWGFKRVFHALNPKNILSYEHPHFKKATPEMVRDMKMTDANDMQHPPLRRPSMPAIAAAPGPAEQDHPLTSSPGPPIRAAGAAGTALSPLVSAAIPGSVARSPMATAAALLGTSAASAPAAPVLPSSSLPIVLIPVGSTTNNAGSFPQPRTLGQPAAQPPLQQAQPLNAGVVPPDWIQNLIAARQATNVPAGPGAPIVNAFAQQGITPQVAVHPLLAQLQQAAMARNLSLPGGGQVDVNSILQAALGSEQVAAQLQQSNQTILQAQAVQSVLQQLQQQQQHQHPLNLAVPQHSSSNTGNATAVQQALIAAMSQEQQRRSAALQLLLNAAATAQPTNGATTNQQGNQNNANDTNGQNF